MHRLLLLVTALLLHVLASAQDLSVTVNGEQINPSSIITSRSIDKINGKIYADLQIFCDDLTSIAITVGNKGIDNIYIDDLTIPGNTMKTYSVEIKDGKSDVVTLSYSPSDITVPNCYCSITIGDSFNFDLGFVFTPKTATIDFMEFYTTPSYQDGCVLTKYRGEAEELTIPEKVMIDNEEYLVREIGTYSFSQKRSIKKVFLPSNIIKIGKAAFFDCIKLEYLNLPEGLVEIEESAFLGCEILPAPTFPSGLKRIANYAYANGFYNIEKLTIPGSLTYIGKENFRNSNIASLVFEDGEEELYMDGDYIFGYHPLYTYLYVGRNFSGNGLSQSYNLSSLHIGSPVKNIDWFEPTQSYNLKQIVSDSMLPPSIGRFSQEQYDNIYVFVPEAALDAYCNDQNWAFFNHISGLEKPAEEYEISIKPNEATVNVGDDLDIQCQVNPQADVYVNWNSSNTDILSVYDMGQLHARALKAGNADVTVTLLLNGKTATCHVTVVQPATEIRLNKTALVLSKGETVKLLANVSPIDVTDPSLTWTSSNPEIATVAEDGTVTAVRGGNCEIIATTHNGLTATCMVKVTVTPESLVLDKTEVQIFVGEVFTLSTTFSPEDATETDLVWTTSDPAIATVENGEIKGIAPGTAMITATTVNNLSTSCSVTILPILAESITVTPQTLELRKASTYQLTAEVLPTNVTDQTVTWISSDENVALVSEDGTVTAVGKGECTITATTSNGLTSICTVTVKVLPETIALDYADAEVIIGETIKLTANLTPEDVTETTLVWTTSNPAVATVENGEIKGIAPGTSVITATTVNEISASCTVTVLPILAESVTIAPESLELLKGSTSQLTVEVLPANVTDPTVTWTSSDENVATVSEDGIVTALGKGECAITATTSNGLTSICTVTVKVLVETIIITPEVIEAVQGTTVQLTAEVLPENASDKTFSWSSSNEAVATVDETGLVSILTPGSSVITATANDEGKAIGECLVTGLSIVEWIKTDDNLWNLYTPTGLLLKSNITVKDLGDIAPGIYILRNGSRNIKIRL